MNTTTNENGADGINVKKQRKPELGERERVVAEWASSGKTVDEMAALTGWSPYTLYRWRLDAGQGKGAMEGTPSRPKLLPVPKPAPVGTGAWWAEVVISSGTSLRLAAGCSPAWAGQLIKELKSC